MSRALLRERYPRIAQAAGELEPYLDDPEVMEVRCNSNGRAFVLRFGQEKVEIPPIPAETLDHFLVVMGSHAGTDWTPQTPQLHMADPKLGFRIEAAGPPISPGLSLVLRKHPSQVFPLEDFVAKGIVTPPQCGILREAIRTEQTVIISGAMGSAKTSLLGALLHELRHTSRRVVILEDDPELQCAAADVEFRRTSEQLGITMEDLGKALLRLSAQWVVIGEVRSGVAWDMIQAFRTGHPGMSTVHAESARDTLERLEVLIQKVSVNPQQREIGKAIKLIVHMTQWNHSWRVTDIIRVRGWNAHAKDYDMDSLPGCQMEEAA